MERPFTMPLDRFWAWLSSHPNCIVRAGTPEAVIYDDDDLHWTFASEAPQTLVAQVLRGKRLVGEVLIDPEQVSFVEALPQENPDEHVFELVSESEDDRFAAWFFVLVHGLDDDDAEVAAGRVH
jgi:hypothetical protein